MTRLYYVAICLTLAIGFPLPLSAGDWPQFLGPNRDNSVRDVVEPWTGSLKPSWTHKIGDAHSSPVVAGGIVYAFYQPKGKNAEALAAFDAKSGELKWEKSYDRPEYKPPFGNGPRSTPAVSNGKVYTFGGTGILACWDAETGNIDWKVNPLTEFKAPNPFFGTSTSPLVVDGKVIVMVGGKGAGVVAFDAKTGKPVWQATDDPASYSSPTRAGKQLVFLTGANLLGLSEKGEKLWSVPFEGKVGPIVESSATPIVTGDLLIGGTVSSGAIGLKLVAKNGVFGTEKVWANKGLTCYFSTPVVVGDYIYMVNGVAALKNASVTLRCVELQTGRVVWEEKNLGEYHACVLRCGPAGKEKLLVLDDAGDLLLIEASPKGFTVLAKSKVCGKTWAHPALVDEGTDLRGTEVRTVVRIGAVKFRVSSGSRNFIGFGSGSGWHADGSPPA
jgi:outer membrane protein assembly factor BamB